MLSLCLKINKTEPLYAYKRNAYKKEHVVENFTSFKLSLKFQKWERLHTVANDFYLFIFLILRLCCLLKSKGNRVA